MKTNVINLGNDMSTYQDIKMQQINIILIEEKCETKKFFYWDAISLFLVYSAISTILIFTKKIKTDKYFSSVLDLPI